MQTDASVPTLQTIPETLEAPPTAHPSVVPTTTLHQELPFGQLTWENFERLCLRLVRTSKDVERCRLYGTKGQPQGGIDLYARKALAEKYTVYQCKRENDFGPTKISAPVTVFLSGNWVDRTDQFILCTKEDLRSAQRTEEIEKQGSILREKNIGFDIWDASELNMLLKQHPQIVDDFFGRAWVKAFNGQTGLDAVGNRLDGPSATAVRGHLKKLYNVTFKADDPGLPVTLASSGYPPLQERYVVPDVSLARSRSQEFSPDSRQLHQSEPSSSSQPAADAQRNPETVQERRSVIRQGVDEWLKDKRQAVILGGPGSGKSTLLRFIALDILSESPRFTLSFLHKNRLPVWVPFGFWTAQIARDAAAEYSIEDVVQRWLHHLSSDNLWPSFKAAIEDERLLLLIDGLDEYRSESAAGTALRQLQVFVELKNCPAILTSRAQGYQRLPVLSGAWQSADLAEFTADQKRQFVSIWTRFRLTDGATSHPDTELLARIATEVERFEADLQREVGLRELAGTPLLLGILVYLSASNLPLPQNRFQAYRRIVDHLIAEHPKSRQRAASLTTPAEPEFRGEDYRKVLAALAFRIFSSHPEGTIERADALAAVGDFLSDAEIGFGYDSVRARLAAERIISECETSLGVLVERAPGLYSFLHRAFLEYLCATHISSLDVGVQIAQVEKYAAEPQWREVLLGVSFLTVRPNELRQLVERLKVLAAESPTPFSIKTILCEIAVGASACPADLCLELCKEFVKEIETGPWMPHRVTLLRILLRGIHSPKVQRLIRDRLRCWYPCRSYWPRRNLYSLLTRDGMEESLREALFRGLLDEEVYVQEAVTSAIASLATTEPQLADRLVEMLREPNSTSVIASISEALLLGWPQHQVWTDLEDRLRNSPSLEHRRIGIRRRIRTNRQDDRDKNELLWMASRQGPFAYRRSDSVTVAIIEGWSGALDIRDKAIQCINPNVYYPDALHPEAAVRILIEGYSADPVATSALCELIRNQEHAFLSGHHEVWKAISEKYVGNPEMIAAADDWLENRSAHHYPEISFAARLGWTPTAKRILLKNVDVWVPFWAAEALLDGWGMEDPEVASTLLALSNSEKAADIGHLFPRIIPDRQTCFTRLISMLESVDCREPGRVLEGIAKVMESTDRERVLAAALKWTEEEQRLNNRERVVKLVLDLFGEDDRAFSLAQRELRRRDGHLTAVVEAYGPKAEIRSEAIKMLSPLPTELRNEILKVLGTNATTDHEAFDLLSLYDLEWQPSLKTKGTLAFCQAVRRSNSPADELLARLERALISGGLDFESRREAAFCGLDILDRLDIVLSARAGGRDTLPIEVSSGLYRNEEFIVHLLSNWSRIQSGLAGKFDKTFFRDGRVNDLSWWDHVAPFVDGFPVVRDFLLSMIEGLPHEQLYSEVLLFLGRQRPGSGLLRDQCLKIIKSRGPGSGRWIEVDTASFLLGRDFKGDPTVLAELAESDENSYGLSDNVLWACCEALSSAAVVRIAFDNLKRKHADGNVLQVGSITDMHLVCIHGTAREVFDSVIEFVSRLHGDFAYHAAACLRPVVRRVQNDVELQALVRGALAQPLNVSETCSAAHILQLAIGVDSELRAWSLKQVSQKRTASLYSSFGFDLTTGVVGTTWEVAMSILEGMSTP